MYYSKIILWELLYAMSIKWTIQHRITLCFLYLVLLPLYSIDNINDLYHNFTTTLSYSISRFSIEVSSNKRNSKTNPWYDKYCKSARRAIKEVVNESLKIDTIKIYKALTKRKKRQYIRKRQENLLHLSKVAPKKFWR